MFLYVLHIEHPNIYLTGEDILGTWVTFWLALSTSKGCLRVQMWFYGRA